MADDRMDRIAAGVARFQSEAFPQRKALFKKLAEGQAPQALFITCSDSRIDPNLLTQTEPGELFICRNAGNIVPPYTNHTGAMTASIEYAVGALKAPDIIICGHMGCGAMQGVMAPETLAEFPHVREWLNYSRAASLVVREKNPELTGEARLNAIVKENVIIQIAHLKTHPFVAARLSVGKTRIHGWVYDIETGGVLAYDERAGEFIPVAEYYGGHVGAANEDASKDRKLKK